MNRHTYHADQFAYSVPRERGDEPSISTSRVTPHTCQGEPRVAGHPALALPKIFS